MPDTTKHLLLVEDEAPLRQAIAEQLSDRGYHVEQAESGEAAIARLADFAFDVIITDLRLPGVDGSAVIEAAVARYPDIIAIVVTGYGTVKDAVEAIKRGASDFVSKPFQIDELLHVLGSSLEQRRLKSENAYLRSQLEERYRFEGVIGTGIPPTPVGSQKRLGFLVGDVAGFPNGRRLSDDVVDIASRAVAGILADPIKFGTPIGDGVNTNIEGFGTTFPYVMPANSGRDSHHVGPGQEGCSGQPGGICPVQ